MLAGEVVMISQSLHFPQEFRITNVIENRLSVILVTNIILLKKFIMVILI